MEYQEVLDFWFNPALDNSDKFKLWFSSNKETDKTIKQAFGHHYEKVDKNERILDPWLSTIKGKLAYIILFDQFTRNVFRGTAKAFEYDHLALRESMKEKDRLEELKKSLTQNEIMFMLMPLMHSEDKEIAEISFETFKKFDDIYKNEATKNNLEFALKHTKIIREFGRYPHRNKALGRENTPQEEEYLKTADTFGQ